MNEEAILISRLKDKIRECGKRNTAVYMGFFTPQEELFYTLQLNKILPRDIKYEFNGGYGDAERKILLLYPSDVPVEYAFDINSILAVVRIKSPLYDAILNHRDYLGSVMGMGIKRETIGDFLPYKEGNYQFCDIIALKEIAGYISENLSGVGKYNASCSIHKPDEIHQPDHNFIEINDTVSSLRIDNIVSSGFSVSRNDSQEYIRSGLVSLNYKITEDADKTIKEGDRISVRGLGRIEYTGSSGLNKKGRIRIQIKKYI